ncbi:hypothetical protein DYB32_005948 [Aphanomyces invadans]|uniref:Signal recognition particle subunit SRP72 n=1 Tax=Aphanomyces invadans TaxID=157072 RepID=A0A3R6V9B9_9STRA|nr:hypothetical protein DYB32_005948 [Aphanomyces invadans]
MFRIPVTFYKVTRGRGEPMATDVQALFVELQTQLQRENYQKAIDTCNKSAAGGTLVPPLYSSMIVYTQHYRLNNFNAAIRIYEALLSNAHASDDTVELKTNLIAAYVAAGRGAELQARGLEIAFNKSLVALQAGDVVAAGDQLRHADRPSSADTGLVAVAQNNIATIQRSKDLFDSLKRLRSVTNDTLREKCSSAQHQVILANTALYDEARDAVDALAQLFPDSAYLPPLQLHLALAEEDPSALPSLVETLKGSKTSSGLLALAHLHCRLGHPGKAADALRLIPEIQHTPGTVATLVALYDAALDAKSSAAIVDAAVNHSSSAVLLEGDGIAKLRQGQYAEAAAAFARLLDLSDVEPERRVRCLAYCVVALSYVDPSGASTRAATLPAIQSSNLSVEDLVRRAPRPRAPAAKKKENRERVLRKRAKRKAQFIASLKAKPDYNPLIGLVNPDPERWIPRKQRSRRGRKNRGKFVGAQGSGMGAQKDALKLDAAARAAAKKAAPAVEKGVLVTDGPSMNRKARKRR